jgi:hypothetical protein
MGSPWPGPGYALVQTGNWGPAKWEYNWAARSTLEELGTFADELGKVGWEMVNFTMVPLNIRAVARGNAVQAMNQQSYENWLYTAMFKRILP